MSFRPSSQRPILLSLGSLILPPYFFQYSFLNLSLFSHVPDTSTSPAIVLPSRLFLGASQDFGHISPWTTMQPSKGFIRLEISFLMTGWLGKVSAFGLEFLDIRNGGSFSPGLGKRLSFIQSSFQLRRWKAKQGSAPR
jgi:hypothetical protein